MNARSLFLLSLVAVTSVRADYQSTVLADSPPGYWRLDAIPSTIVSYAVNLGVAGAEVDGVIGNYVREGLPGALAGDADPAMQFLGHASSRIVVPYSYALNQGGSFTFECWMNPGCAQGNAQALVVNRQGESGYTIYINADGSFSFNMSRGGVGGAYWSSCVITNPATVASMVGKWTHIACVYDQDAGTTGFGAEFIYTNGVLAATNEIADQPWVPNPGPGTFNLGDRNFAGLLDEVAVYSVALDAATILAHCQAGTNGLGQYQAMILADAPDGYWRLGETDGFVPAPVLAENLGTVGVPGRGTYDLGTRLQQPGALAGSPDKSAYFDGLKMMTAPPGVALNPQPPFSVEFWAKPAVAYSGSTAQACVLGGTDRDFGRSGWLFYQGGNGWSWWLGTTAAYTIQMDPTMSLDTTQWYHVVGTYDGTTARLYVNGAELMNRTGAFSPNPSRPITLGSRYDGYGYQGGLDEVAIYSSLLSPADVLAHYQNGTNAAPSQTYDSLVLAHGPRAYWRLGEASTGADLGIVNKGWLGSAVDGSVVGSLALDIDTPLAGDSSPAINFAGGGRIAIPFDPALNRTNAFSYEFWYKEDVGAGGIRCPLWWRDEPVLGDTRGWVHYMWDSWDPNWAGRGVVFQSSDVYTTWNGLGSATLYAQGEWQHLVCTFDGNAKRIHLNGVLIAVSTTPKLAVKPVTRAVTTISSASYPWLGSLDEVAIYTNALPVERIQAHYVAARGVQPPSVPPTFGVDAVGVTSYEGATVTIRTVVLGTAPFTYQWYKGATPVPGQTTDTLTLSPVQESDSGDYTLAVSNAGGSAESLTAAVLILKAPPTIVTEPQPAVRMQGSSVTLAVDCAGSLPLVYQWKSNSVEIVGANASTLTLDQVQPSFAADYSVSISNAAGSVISQTARLTVVPVAPGSLAAVVVADGPVAYWRLDEAPGDPVAHDYTGGHDGAYDPGVLLGEPGGILGETNPSAAFSYGGITVPYSADLNPYATFSLEAWVKIDPSGAGTDRPILWSSTTYMGWAYGYILSADSSDQWAFTTGQKTSGFDTIAGGSTTSEGWNHLVCTFDDATGAKRLFANGALVAETTTATGTYAPNQRTEDGVPPFDQGIGVELRNYASFVGGLDEVAFYDYALSPEQVSAHHQVGGAPTLGISASGNQVTITWSLGRLLESTSAVSSTWTPVAGASPPSHTLTTTPTAARFYRVVYP